MFRRYLLCAPTLAALIIGPVAQAAEPAAEQFAQLGPLLDTPTEVRLASGAPGPAYWQQRADYKIDVTIDDLVADMRAPTPSAAAELGSQDQAHLQQQVTNLSQRLNKAIQTQLAKKQHQQRYLQQSLMSQHPQHKLQQQNQKLDELSLRLNQAVNRHISTQKLHLTQLTGRLQSRSPVHKLATMQQQQTNLQTRLHSAMQRRIQQEQSHLQNLAQQLQTVSPLATLTRGYSITQNDKQQVITSVAKLKSGDKLLTRFTDGEIQSTID